MRIFEISAENMQSLRVVQIVPRRGVTVIAGPNGAGKSTALDLPFWALGGKGALPEVPLRQGTHTGRVVLKVGTEDVEFVVTREVTIDDDGKVQTALTVAAPNGAHFRRPQELVASWLGALTFDPFAFDRMKPAEQVKALQTIAPLPGDVGLWETEARVAFDERTIVNRKVKELSAKLAGMATVPLAIDGGKSVDELTKALADVGRQNSESAAERAGRKRERDAILANFSQCDRLRAQAAALLKEAEELEAVTSLRKNRLDDANELEPVPPDVDPSLIVADLERAREVERTRAAMVARDAVADELVAARTQADLLTATIAEREQAIRNAVAAAKMPVPGLSYGAEGILLRGLPLAQASTAERLRVALAIGMAANPTLRCLYVREGSLLDDESRAIVEEMAEAHGFDVTLEVVGDSPVGFVLRGGEVVKIDGVAVEAAHHA